ncbi:MAG: matrixin family metalloprotease [Gemmatimonadaceae bacterium]
MSMFKTTRRWLAPALLIAAAGCRPHDSNTASVSSRDWANPVLRVAFLGAGNDSRIPFAREALAHWNSEFARLGVKARFDSGTVRGDSVPDNILASASVAVPYGGLRDNTVLERITDIPADVVIALSQGDFVSFSIPWKKGSKGVVGLRRADIPPLTLPNTVRNVVAHELGHVLGLSHNADSTTLMCGRPASCRPSSFVSDSARFFPLTAKDEATIRAVWRSDR